MKEYRRNKMAV